MVAMETDGSHIKLSMHFMVIFALVVLQKVGQGTHLKYINAQKNASKQQNVIKSKTFTKRTKVT